MLPAGRTSGSGEAARSAANLARSGQSVNRNDNPTPSPMHRLCGATQSSGFAGKIKSSVLTGCHVATQALHGRVRRLPSLRQHGQAGCAGRSHEGGPSRGRDRGPGVRRGPRPTGPLDELARCSRTALRCTALRFASFAAHVPDCHPGHPPRPQPGRWNAKSARAGSTAMPVAALGGMAVAGTPDLVNLGGPLAASVAPAAPSRRPRLLGPRGFALAARRAGARPPRSPHGAPVSG